jgi:hypothetical protein
VNLDGRPASRMDMAGGRLPLILVTGGRLPLILVNGKAGMGASDDDMASLDRNSGRGKDYLIFEGVSSCELD